MGFKFVFKGRKLPKRTPLCSIGMHTQINTYLGSFLDLANSAIETVTNFDSNNRDLSVVRSVEKSVYFSFFDRHNQ